MPSLKKQTRAELNERAKRLGIEDVEDLDTRADVIEAIEAVAPDEDVPPLFAEGGALILSVFGPFGSQVLVQMPATTAHALFGDRPRADFARAETVDGVLRDLAEIAKRDSDVAESALAATAVRMALELEHPFNSATSKAQCAKELRRTMDRLLELAPPGEDGEGALDELKRRLAKRRAAA